MTRPFQQAPPMPGEQIAAYTLVESIGLGGNATVFKATSEHHGVVAIKVLHPGKLAELDIKRFHREFQAMKTLNHTNIITVFESGMHGSYPWMSMELVTGGDLNAKVLEWNDASPKDKYIQITHVLSQLCLALEHLHTKRMIHRDLKPSNILLTEFGQVKLTDFGGVKAPHSFKTDLTTLGSLVGTVAFMAPEQILGEAVDQRTDLYTLGSILYMSLTGVKPFEAKTMAEYLAKHLNQEAPSPATVRPETPEYLTLLCQTLMQKEPAKRIQTAKEVHAILNNQGSGKHPFGCKEVIESSLTWINKNPTGILLLSAHKGMGLKACFKYLVRVLKDNQHETMVQVGYTLPPISKHQKILFCTASTEDIPDDFFERLRRRIEQGEPIHCIINTVDKWTLFTTSLRIPKKAHTLPSLSIEQIQQLLYPFGLDRSALHTLGTRIHHMYQGRVEYIQEILRMDWAHSLSAYSLSDLDKLRIPSSSSSIEHQRLLWKGIPKPVLPVLSVILIFNEPISPINLSRLMEVSEERLMPILSWLEHNQWIDCIDVEMSQQINLHPSRFSELLYRLLQPDQLILWHNNIANFLMQKVRLRPSDREHILYHLEQLGPSIEANEQRLVLAMHAQKNFKWNRVLRYTQNIHYDLLTEQDSLKIFHLNATAYFQTSNIEQARYFVEKLLLHPLLIEKERIPLQFKLFVLQHHAACLDLDTDGLDARWPSVDLSDPTQRQAMVLRGIQHCYYGRTSEAHTLWTNVAQQIEGDIPQQQAEVGLAFLSTLKNQSDSFVNLLADLPENQTEPWNLWFLEQLLVSGKWTQLQAHLEERQAFERTGLIEEIFETWVDYLHGNAPRARERLQGLQEQDLDHTKPSNIRMMMHLVRLQKRLKLPMSTPLIRWSRLPNTIEGHRYQWSCLQQGTLNLNDVSVFWQRDLMILDAAMFPTEDSQKDVLWSQISPTSWGIRIQVSKRFSDETQDPKWVKIHRQTIRNCARHMTGDIHTWR